MSKITISGKLGSGKSTIAKRLSNKLDIPYHSTGTLQRKLATESNLSTLELNKIQEENKSIDQQLDDSTKNLDQTEDAFILDSRMAWHFVKRSFKLYLYVDPAISAERIFNDQSRSSEKYVSIQEAQLHIQEREQSEIRRFQKLYKVNLTDFSNYDAVIDTSFILPDVVIPLILALHKQWQDNGSVTNSIWLSPKLLYPTQCNNADENANLEVPSTADWKMLIDYPNPISVIREKDAFFIYERHQQAAQFIGHGIPLIPCVLPFAHSDDVSKSEKHEFVKQNCTLNTIQTWEQKLGFQFHKYPVVESTLE